jgi:hypothetical protein
LENNKLKKPEEENLSPFKVWFHEKEIVQGI